MKTISTLIPGQIPEHLRTDAPIFVDFLKTYYQYAEQLDSGLGVIQNFSEESDIDLCQEKYIDDFYATYGNHIPSDLAMDRRNFLKLLRTIYEAKGTEKAIKLLFLAVFNDAIEVSYPGNFVLRASDGRWSREQFVTLTTIFGTPPAAGDQLSFSNATGSYVFEALRVENVGTGLTRIFFQTYSKMQFDDAQRVQFFNSAGVLQYVGDLVLSPASFTILNPGADWLVGQVVIIPGSQSDTICRVTSINSTGGVTGLEVIEYGHAHDLGQITTISPYPNKPETSGISVSSVLTSISPDVYTHTLNIDDSIDGISEEIVGISDGISSESYMAEDYWVRGYGGWIAFAQSNLIVSNPTAAIDTGLTLEQWLASRMTIIFEFSKVVTARGFFKTEDGQLSNQSIRLQDNYFYQPFSYLIDTHQDIRSYQEMMQIIHPAGTKRFSNLILDADISVVSTIERNIASQVGGWIDPV